MLTPTDIDRLCAAGESLTVEFKSEAQRRLSDGELVENVVCLANTDGGTLLLGVEDDGSVTGARPRHEGDVTDPRRVAALVTNATRPAVSVEVDLVRHPQGEVLAVQVPRSRVAVATSRGRYVRRMIGVRGEPECVPLFFYELAGAGLGLGVPDPTLIPVAGATWDDLDPLEFDRLRRFIEESGGRGDASLLELSSTEIAKALGAVEGNGEGVVVRLLGLLLFGREAALRRFVPTHEVAFQELNGAEVGINDFFRWPLLRVFDEITARFRHRLHATEVVTSHGVRIEVPDYSEGSFREALANALVHRDYRALGAVHVQWHADHLRIDNPGGFPPGVCLDNFLVSQPRPRNPMLADAFKRAGLVERTGRGIDLVFEGQLRFGRQPPGYDLSGSESVSVVFPGGPADLALTRYLADEQRRAGRLRVQELLVLGELRRRGSATLERASRLLQGGEEAAARVLDRLRERGLIAVEDDAGEYGLSVDVCKALEGAASA